MTQEKLKQFLDACFDAKRLIEKLPDLPDGMKPRQVHVLDAVNEIQKKQGFCRVSDISSYMNTTLPSITKLVQELEERNLLVKQADEKDKRVINLTLTEEGKEFVELRVTHFRRGMGIPPARSGRRGGGRICACNHTDAGNDAGNKRSEKQWQKKIRKKYRL